MGSKKPDAKAIVSFSSDSDEDDSSSSSSRLSSSASSGEESDVETFSVAFPAPSKTVTQGVAVGGGGGGGGGEAAVTKVESKTRPETKKTEPVKTISPEPRKSPVAEAKDKSALKRTNASEEAASRKDPITTKDKLTASDSIKEVRKSPGKQEETSDTLDVKKKGGNSVSSERPKSPKIIINDVDEEDTSKQTKKNPGNDVTVTSDKVTSKTRAASPKKTSNDDTEVDLPCLSLKSRKDGVRAVSPKKEDTTEDVVSEVTKTPKRSPKLTAEREKPPKDTKEEPASVSDVKSVDRAKSPKKTAVDKDVERAKSPKKTLDVQDSERATSPKKTLGETDTERAKSPKKIAEGGEETKKKSSKDSSKTPYELLRSVESPEKSPTRSTKPKKSLTTEDDLATTPKRKSPLKDLEGKEQEDAVETAKPKKASKKTGKTILSDENVINDDVAVSRKDGDARSGKVKDESNADGDQSQKTGVSEAKAKDQSDTASEVEQLLKEIRQKRITSQLESETPDEGGDKLIRVKVDETTAAKTDETPKTPRDAAEVKDKDYMKVTGTSRSPAADETTGTNKPDLENEESEFTYRRKSMDDFIKRILAEAKEERLKQKHGGGGAASNETSTTTTEGDERKAGVDRYAERNGGITENGLDGGTKWNGGGGGSSEDKEGSKLDRRLAKIEKRRFGESASDAGKGEGGGGGGVEGGRSKVVGKETEEKSAKDKTDYDVNLDEDLEEINRFLQSRKTAAAASRFDFDEPQLNDDDDPTTATPNTASPTKRRWATTSKDPQQLPADEDDLQPRSQIKKKYSSNVDADFDDDDDRFIGRFKRDSVVVPEESFSPRRRDETDEIIRERTRNVRVLVDQQVEIVQAMRTTSKSLDELEKEIREVRQVCLNRQARIEALEGALGAEYRAFENDQVAATDRQKDGSSLMGSREDFGGLAAGTGRLRRQDKFKSESLDEENFPFRRRSGSVASTTSYTSGFEGSRGRNGEDGGLDSRPPSGLKQSRRTSEGESDLSSGLDRRRGGSAARDRIGDVTPFGPDDLTNSFLSQRSARSRASIATSTPAIDYAGAISGDSFLAKIRAKYSFLNPAIDSQSYSSPSSIRGNSGISSSSSNYAVPSSLTYGKRLGSRDILSSPSAYSSYGTGGGGYGGLTSFTTTGGGRYSSIRDSRSPSYGSGGFVGTSSITGISSSSYGGDSGGRMRRAQSVSEVSFDRPSSYSATDFGSTSGGEFHSRFLDKVRGKKAMGDDTGTSSSIPSSSSAAGSSSSSSQNKGQEKPFKSRFLKSTTSFDAGTSRSERLTNGFEDGNDAGGYGRGGGSSEINGDA